MLDDTQAAKRATFGLKPTGPMAKTGSAPGASAGKLSRVNGYLVSWMALAAFAFGYIGVAASRPDLLPGVVPMSDSAEQLAGGRSPGDIADEIASLRKWVNDLQHEMVATKSTLKDNAEQHHALLQRMSQAEGRLGTPREIRAEAATKAKQLAEAQKAATKVAAAPAEAPESKPVQVAALAPSAPSAPAAAAAPQPGEGSVLSSSAAQGLKVINGGPPPEPQASPVVTGSIVSPAAAAAQAPQTTPAATAPAPRAAASAPAVQAPVAPTKVAATESSPRGIEIAEAESLDGLRSRWSNLASRNTELKSLSPRYRIAAGAATETPFTLLAGPFPNTADATRACAQLRANGVKCKVSDFSGNGL